MREFLATKQITVLEYPAYSPGLAPSDFFLFPKIKEILKGRHFDVIDDIRSNTVAALKAVPQNQIQNCFEGGTRHWHWCIASQGDVHKMKILFLKLPTDVMEIRYLEAFINCCCLV